MIGAPGTAGAADFSLFGLWLALADASQLGIYVIADTRSRAVRFEASG